MFNIMQIPMLIPEMEELVIWDNGFSEEDLQEIIGLGELCSFNNAEVGGDLTKEVNPDVRVTDVAWIDSDERSQWLYGRLSELAARINYDKYRIKIDQFQPLQYSKYKVGGFYNWHVDNGPGMAFYRKLSFVLALSDLDDYEGGELELNLMGNQDDAYSLKIKKGHLVVFPSYIPHQVTEVTSGERLTLVGWAIGPKYV